MTEHAQNEKYWPNMLIVGHILYWIIIFFLFISSLISFEIWGWKATLFLGGFSFLFFLIYFFSKSRKEFIAFSKSYLKINQGEYVDLIIKWSEINQIKIYLELPSLIRAIINPIDWWRYLTTHYHLVIETDNRSFLYRTTYNIALVQQLIASIEKYSDKQFVVLEELNNTMILRKREKGI